MNCSVFLTGGYSHMVNLQTADAAPAEVNGKSTKTYTKKSIIIYSAKL